MYLSITDSAAYLVSFKVLRTIQFRSYLVQSGHQPLFDVVAVAQEQCKSVVHLFVALHSLQIGDGRRSSKLKIITSVEKTLNVTKKSETSKSRRYSFRKNTNYDVCRR